MSLFVNLCQGQRQSALYTYFSRIETISARKALERMRRLSSRLRNEYNSEGNVAERSMNLAKERNTNAPISVSPTWVVNLFR